MSDSRCFEKGHLKREAFTLLDNENLDTLTRYKISEHLASCNICSESYTDFLTADLQVDLPEGLNEKILKKAGQLNPVLKNSRFTALQFFKLATAAVLAISFYSTGIFNSFFNITNEFKDNIPQTAEYLQSKNSSITQRFNKGFFEFSQKINLDGVDFYEKK